MPTKQAVKKKSPTKNRLREGKKGRANLKLVQDGLSEPTVDELLNDLPEDFLQCRSYNNHLLSPLTTFRWGTDGECICRVSECASCGTRREDYHLPNGEKMDSRYDWPEGYIITGHGRIPTTQIMRILMSHIEIVDPKDLPSGVTERLSNKALMAIAETNERNQGKQSKRGGRKRASR